MNGSITSVNSAPNLGRFTSTIPPQEKMVREPACVCVYLCARAKCVTASSSRAAGVAGIDAKQVSGILKDCVTSAPQSLSPPPPPPHPNALKSAF